MSYENKQIVLDLQTLKLRIEGLIHMANTTDRPILQDEIATINEYSEYLGTLVEPNTRAAPELQNNATVQQSSQLKI